MTDGTRWGQWVAQAILTIVLAALAAFGGIKAGLSEAQQQIVAVKASQVATERRLDRIEDKLDRIIERRTGR